MRLEKKTAVITGGGTGIGLACAKLFSREGANVVIFGRRKERLEQARAEIGGTVETVPGDILRKEDIERLVEHTLETFHRIDILVNNSGIFVGAPIHEMDDGLWNRVLEVNLRGVFQLTKRVLPTMMEQGSGSLIHISSILGLVAVPETAAYNASKAALIQFSRSVAVEYGSFGIRSNTVCPGLIATEMTEDLMKDRDLMKEWSRDYPIGRFGVPEDVAQACLYLAGDESSFVTGAVLPVDGGYTAR